MGISRVGKGLGFCWERVGSFEMSFFCCIIFWVVYSYVAVLFFEEIIVMLGVVSGWFLCVFMFRFFENSLFVL